VHTTHTTIRRRRGVASLFGTLIFIGILFTAVIPMYLVMNQADVIFEQEKHSVAQLDDEKDREDLYFYVYPDLSDDLMVVVENKCAMSVKVVRVWINEEIQVESTLLATMETVELGPYDVSLVVGSTYDVRVTTERGNVFESGSGELEYGESGWVVESKLINVMVSASGIVFKIYLYKWEDSSWVEKDWAQVWKIGGSAFKPFEVTEYGNGEYRVVVKRGSATIHDEEDLMMEWPNGPSTLWVYS